jgi:hypothetical protein
VGVGGWHRLGRAKKTLTGAKLIRALTLIAKMFKCRVLQHGCSQSMGIDWLQ